MPLHPHADSLCSCGSNSSYERARLARMPANINLIEQMVTNHFEVAATEATFRALFDQFVRREVA